MLQKFNLTLCHGHAEPMKVLHAHLSSVYLWVQNDHMHISRANLNSLLSLCRESTIAILNFDISNFIFLSRGFPDCFQSPLLNGLNVVLACYPTSKFYPF